MHILILKGEVKMGKSYEPLVIEIITFASEDIITCSGPETPEIEFPK